MSLLKINNLKAQINSTKILNGVDLNINKNEIHVIMGPNGSGKSTLSNAIMGNPKIRVTSGTIDFEEKNVTKLKPEDRAKLGIFMAFQYPREIEGVQLNEFLFAAYNSISKGFTQSKAGRASNKSRVTHMDVFEFNKKLEHEANKLNMDPEFLTRVLNKGFSGGEKKKAEMLQLSILNPKLAILDETDSGLDVDALKIVSKAINNFHNKNNSILLITHYQRILKYIKPDYVHVMIDGKIVKSGKKDLARELEKKGYETYS